MRIFWGVKGYGAIDQRGQTFQLYLCAAQADIGIHPGHIPETTAFFHQIGKATLNQYIDGYTLMIGVDGVIIDPTYRDLAEINQRTAVERA